MTDLRKKLRLSEQRIEDLEQDNRAILSLLDKVEALSQFQDRIDRPSDISRIWDAFLREIREHIEVDICALFLVEETTHEFTLAFTTPDEEAQSFRQEIESQIESGMFGWVITRRQPALVPSLSFKNRRPLMMLPLVTSRNTLGVIIAATPLEESAITLEKLKVLAVLARQCSLVVENALLYERLRGEHESLVRAQAQIIQAEKFASLGRLTSGICHELLNPLNIISGRIQLLQLDPAIRPDVLRYLMIMKAQGDRIARIVQDLLRFTDSPQSVTRLVEVNRLLRETVGRVLRERGAESVVTLWDLSSEELFVRGATESLVEVFSVLTHNAVDAMAGKGRIEITTRLTGAPDLLPAGGEAVEIRFSDTGRGIARDNIHKVFDPFFTTKGVGEGMGLNLALSYAAVRSMGGMITVDPGRDYGATFVLVLPRSIAPPGAFPTRHPEGLLRST